MEIRRRARAEVEFQAGARRSAPKLVRDLYLKVEHKIVSMLAIVPRNENDSSPGAPATRPRNQSRGGQHHQLGVLSTSSTWKNFDQLPIKPKAYRWITALRRLAAPRANAESSTAAASEPCESVQYGLVWPR